MKKIINKIIFAIILVFLVFSPKNCSAEVPPWPDLIAESYGQMLDVAYDQIIGAIMGAAKQAAAQAVSEAIQSAVSSGGSSNDESASTMFIANWDEFLHVYPEKKAELYMNDFFSALYEEKGSGLNYIPNGGSSVSGSYISQLTKSAKQQIGLESAPEKPCDISDSSTLFQDGDWSAYNSLYGSDKCNTFGTTLMAESAYEQEISRQEDEARTKAISYQGFKGKTSGGSIITPGSTIKDIQSAAEDLPNKIIAGSTKIPEIITALATRMAVSTIKQGIGSAKAQISKSVSAQTSNVQGIVNKAIGSNPQAGFMPKY